MTTLFYPEFGARNGGLTLGIVGAIFFPLGAIGEWKVHKSKMNLIREFEGMSIEVSACPHCKKEVLHDSFEFCPFCGKPLRQ